MNILWRSTPSLLLLFFAALVGYALLGYPAALNSTTPEAMLANDEKPVTPVQAKPNSKPTRVILVVLDGLRLDTSLDLPYLNSLRTKGLSASAKSPLPSFSKPSYASMGTGASPWRSGIRTNSLITPVPADTVFARMREAGLALHGAANNHYWPEVFKDQFTRWWIVPSNTPSKEVDHAMHDILSEPSALTVLHFAEIDAAGHNHGASHPIYRKTALDVDTRLQKLLANVDLNKEMVVVVSDHGHRGQGGHGGNEPEVRTVPFIMAGYGTKPGTATLGGLEGIAPTIALLTGVEFPRDMNAGPYTASLDPKVFGQAYLDARGREWQDHRTKYEQMWLSRTYTRWTSTDWNDERVGNDVSDATQVEQNATLDALINAREATLFEIDRDRRVGRTPLIALLAVLLLFVGVFGLFYGYRARPLLAMPVFAITLGVSHLVMDRAFSFSAISTKQAFVTETILLSLVAAFVYMVALEGMLRLDRKITRKGGATRPPRSEIRRYHLGLTALCYLALVPTLWLLMGYNIDAPLPDPAVLFAPMLLGVAATTLVGFAALFWCVDIVIHPRSKPEKLKNI